MLTPIALLQDDIAKFVSDPTPPPQHVDIPEEGKGKAKEHREVSEGDDTVTLKLRPMRRTGRCCRSDFNYGPGSADLGCPMSPLSRIHRLAWRLVSQRRRGGRAMWHANV
jgi:hypothetical protein